MQARGALAAAVGMVLVGIGSVMGLLAFEGVAPWQMLKAGGHDDHGEQQATWTLAAEQSPASEFVEELLSAVDAEWGTTGRIDGALPPYPLSCGPRPAGSVLSTTVTVSSQPQVQLYLSVHPAGIGAQRMVEETSRRSLAGCDATAQVSAVEGLGTQAYQVAARWDGHQTTTLTWRHGDVLLYTVADQPRGLRDLASKVDDLAAPLLSTCVDPGSTRDDADRNPITDNYQGWLVDHEVTIPPPRRGQATDLPDEWHLEEVPVPRVPDYPVWPELPPVVPLPVEPPRPEDPALSQTVQLRQEDSAGPGCGWAFTGQAAPQFDRVAVQDRNDAVVAEAEDELNSGVEDWGRQLADFWKAWPQFEEEAQRYSAYTQELHSVTVAWEAIAQRWASYERAYARYADLVEAREELIEDQEAARAELAKAEAKCEDQREQVRRQAEQAQREPDPDPETADISDDPEQEDEDNAQPTQPEVSPAPTPDPTATTTPSTEIEGCPPATPDILTEVVPPEPTAPTPPPDPRPTDLHDTSGAHGMSAGG